MIRSLIRWIVGPNEPKPKRHLSEGEIAARIIGVYFLIAALTFGYEAARYPDMETECMWDRNQSTGEQSLLCKETGFTDSVNTVFKGTAAGVAWPLFWTWEGFTLYFGKKGK